MLTPGDENELIDLLRQHAGLEVRALGSLHAWSDVAATGGGAVNLARMRGIRVEREDDGPLVHVQGGCRVRELQSELVRHGLSLPSLGLIGAQTVAGAVATGTHGSGRHSLSHYVERVRAVTIDSRTGQPEIREWTGGDGLRAARCAMGRMGVHTELTFRCVPLFDVEERTARFDTIEQVTGAVDEWPLQQFYLIPWSWSWYAHQRRETNEPRPWYAPLYRLYRFLWLDVGFHLLVQVVGRWLHRPKLIRGFYRRLFPWLMFTRPRTVDRVDRVLLMRHELFRHVEMELFVPESKIMAASDFVRGLLEYAGGEATTPDAHVQRVAGELGLGDELKRIAGRYTHHFPITFRRVLADDTLISMSAGDGPRYAISLISYDIHHLDGFEAVMALLARTMAKGFDARPHWGKLNPLGYESSLRLCEYGGRFESIIHQASSPAPDQAAEKANRSW